MSHLPSDTDLKNWHRYFAIECNNRAWTLATANRTPADDEEMLNAAHSSAFHWRLAGTELHTMRAKMLLAEVHSLLGHGHSALAYAEEIRGYFLDKETPDWEIAFTHTIYAHAVGVAGEKQAYQQAYRQAEQAIAAVVDDAERKIVLKTFEQMPAP